MLFFISRINFANLARSGNVQAIFTLPWVTFMPEVLTYNFCTMHGL